jgi:hypothetical protein
MGIGEMPSATRRVEEGVRLERNGGSDLGVSASLKVKVL